MSPNGANGTPPPDSAPTPNIDAAIEEALTGKIKPDVEDVNIPVPAFLVEAIVQSKLRKSMHEMTVHFAGGQVVALPHDLGEIARRELHKGADGRKLLASLGREYKMLGKLLTKLAKKGGTMTAAGGDLIAIEPRR